ncbi:replication-associated recombination protein A [Phytomonospora endophytica]|uniref:Putative ATPase n=1 Tax=Phytomonospora endophytica TaxID=714109 RepID=A0A841FR06_9ACTN|nr:replication-associated recombination protein A [Phytomonospora endophytica]MBB6038615.1 putative ATPase [Phytomonospora endophytica]GIG69241.1 ATPase AAA [Phytomonospora endophytica]
MGRTEPALPLFGDEPPPRPLADRLRPSSIDEVVGQDHLLAADAPIGRMLARGQLVSTILWGPPGSGKTTIARLLAERTDLAFEPLSATFSGVADLRKIFAAAQRRRDIGQGTLLFVDEVHRFNRAQQDSFLPYVEDGTIILVGATTENPSFELNGALLSRCQVFVLKQLDTHALETLLTRAEADTGRNLPLDADARGALIAMAGGDGRYLLNLAEQLQALPEDTAPLDTAGLAAEVHKRAPLYDKSQEGHYNLISALHKAMRGSDPDASLYWLARMLDGGEDPLFIARRLIRFANEDIGTADPHAVHQALAAWEVYERLGSPEGELAIAQAVAYLATAPKSIAVYRGFAAATRSARQTGSLMPPMHIRNAPTRLMKDLGYGKDYQYDPDTTDGFSGANYFPDDMDRETFYRPTANGHEAEIGRRLRHWNALRAERSTEVTEDGEAEQ